MWSELGPIAMDWGPPGLVMAAVVTGWLVPRWIHRERIKDLKEQIAEKNATIKELLKHHDELMEFAHTTVAAFHALPKAKEPL